MSELLSYIQEAFRDALSSIRELSARTPGTLTTQAVGLGVVVGAISYLLLKKRYRLPPGPFALPLVGNLMAINSDKEPYYMTLARLTEKYGPVIMIYMGPVPCVTFNRVDVVMEALVKKSGHFSHRPYFYSMEMMTEGNKDIVFGNDSKGWKIHRKIAVQALRHYMSGSHLEEVVHKVVSKGMDIMAARPGPFNPHAINSMMMFVMIDMFCFGHDCEMDDPELLELKNIFDKVTSEFGNGFLEDIIPPLRYFPTKKFRNFTEGINSFLRYIYTGIDEHRKAFSPDNIRDITDSILLAQVQVEQEEGTDAVKFFTNTHVGQTVFDLFSAGVDTSRMTLDWGLYCLASFPEVQKRMQAEIDSVAGHRLPGIADRPKLPFTEATLYEIMRVGPVVPLGVPHKTSCDTAVAGYEIPEDTVVFVNHWALLNDPQQFDNPGEFRPERYLDEQGQLKTRPDSWLPFSAGRRVCLGESVAKPELLLILACIVKRFSLSLAPGCEFTPKPKVMSSFVHLPQDYEIVVKERSA